MEYRVVPIDDPVEMPAAQIVEDNPVHKYEIIESPVKKIRVGYLMYNSFTAGTKAEPEK